MQQVIFKTRRGNNYRAVYIVEGRPVTVLRIRGTGQPLLDPGELPA